MRLNAFSHLFAISLTIALALGLTACTSIHFKPVHPTSAYECQRQFQRGMIRLEQERLCRMGQSYDVLSVHIQK